MQPFLNAGKNKCRTLLTSGIHTTHAPFAKPKTANEKWRDYRLKIGTPAPAKNIYNQQPLRME